MDDTVSLENIDLKNDSLLVYLFFKCFECGELDALCTLCGYARLFSFVDQNDHFCGLQAQNGADTPFLKDHFDKKKSGNHWKSRERWIRTDYHLKTFVSYCDNKWKIVFG